LLNVTNKRKSTQIHIQHESNYDNSAKIKLNTTRKDFNNIIEKNTIRTNSNIDSTNEISFYVVDYDKNEYHVKGKVEERLFDVLSLNGIVINSTCGKQMQCAECNCILSPEIIKSEYYIKPSLNEEDVLCFLRPYTKFSRYSCQLKISKAFENKKVYLLKKQD
jgi:ferredoxin